MLLSGLPCRGAVWTLSCVYHVYRTLLVCVCDVTILGRDRRGATCGRGAPSPPRGSGHGSGRRARPALAGMGVAMGVA